MTTWRLEVRDSDGSCHDVVLDADVDAPTAELRAQLISAGFRAGHASTRGIALSGSGTIGQLGLRHGDTIDLGDPSDAAAPSACAGLFLVIVCGPLAGTWHALTPGRVVVGRSGPSDVVLDDPVVSGTHLAITVGSDGTVHLEDLSSTNGTWIEGSRLSAGLCREIAPGTHVAVGTSVISFEVIPSTDISALDRHGPGPDTVFPRRFRAAHPPLPTHLTPPRPPPVDDVPRAPWWRSLTPVVTGLGFAVMTGRWQFLVIVALAPLLFTIDAQLQRRRRTADRLASLAAHAESLDTFQRRVDEVRSTERTRDRQRTLTGGTAALFAALAHHRLWERTRGDCDFGEVSLGLAPMPSLVDAGDDDAVEGSPRSWGRPLTVSLRDLGWIGLTGPARRCAGVARSLVIGLATTHSPTDLQIWFIGDLDRHESVDEWRFLRWLPHLRLGATTASFATDVHSRASLIAMLRARLDNGSGGSTDGGLHLVIVDGAAAVPDPDLADLVARGRAVGIVGIVIDATTTPEGVRGHLRLAANAEHDSYESCDQVRLDGVSSPELTVQAAELAARRLASLRASGDHRSMPEIVNLVDLPGMAAIGCDDVVERWQRLSPRTGAVVGVAAGVPLVIDIAEHGPHGLVGGMSGSGKTEFLLTLLTSLCLDNHPDDLAIVVVDFKGAVDHGLTARLPHVIALSTNLEIEHFSRTIDLLDAEQRRRQTLFAGIGSDLDAYRAARSTRPQLPPLPRLLIVVDEFSELLATETGRARLQELIRVTRIGRALGVHLLLVTQNFEGQLPPQVDANAGLRVCLRVMKPSHSKVVLDTDVAAGISDTQVGRAFVRFPGGELVDFQTARVAGRRRDLPSTPGVAAVRRVTVSDLTPGRAEARRPSVPLEETDMYALTGVLHAAAMAVGWTGTSLPWPPPLPTEVPLGDFLRRHRPNAIGGVPIGLQDCPDQQRQDVIYLDDADERMLFLGEAGAGMAEVLRSIATAAAINRSPGDLHLHAIDLDGSGLAALADLPHVGTIASRDDGLARRLLAHLHDEVSRRRALLADYGCSTVRQLSDATGDRTAQIMVVIAGADRLVRRTEDTGSVLLGPLVELVAEAPGTGLQILLAGLPSLADSRLGLSFERRFVFALPGETNPVAYGAPRHLVADLGPMGRAIDVAAKRLTQFALVGDSGPAGSSQRADLAHRLRISHRSSRPWPSATTLVNVPWPLAMADLRARVVGQQPCGLRRPLPVGVDTNTGDVAWLDLDEDGPVVAVTGPRQSGRSSALASIAFLARHLGWTTVALLGSRRSPLASAVGVDFVAGPTDIASMLQGLPMSSDGSPLVILCDDAQRIDPASFDLALLHRAEPAAIFLAGPIDFLTGRHELRSALPTHRAGLLLAPTSSLDGAAVGLGGQLRGQLSAKPRPGRGFLAVAGDHREVQLPLPPSAAGAYRSEEPASR